MRKLIILCIVLLGGCDQAQQVAIFGNTMGTTYSIKVISADIDQANLSAEIETRLREINGLMSTYMPDSELSRFNQSPTNEWFAVSAETIEVLEMAADIYRLSDGSFDVTVGPLVNLWGFGPNPKPDQSAWGQASHRDPRDHWVRTPADTGRRAAQGCGFVR